LLVATGVLVPIAGAACVAVIIARELMISGFRQVAAKTGFVMAADKLGKYKTFVQDVAMIVLMFALQFPTAKWLYWTGNVLLFAATALTIASGLNYLIKNRSVFKDEEK